MGECLRKPKGGNLLWKITSNNMSFFLSSDELSVWIFCWQTLYQERRKKRITTDLFLVVRCGSWSGVYTYRFSYTYDIIQGYIA